MRTVLLTSIIICGVSWLLLTTNNRLQVAWPAHLLSDSASADIDFDWPPKLNRPYPDLQLLDQNGTPTRLSDFKGHIILLEPVGMPCKACQAFSGGHQRGGFAGIAPQPGLPSIERAARTYGRFNLSDDRIVKIHLLLYNLNMRAPTVDDAKAWAEHFGFDRARNEVVLAGTPTMIGDASYQMIPGLQSHRPRVGSTGRQHRTLESAARSLPRTAAQGRRDVACRRW